MSDPLAPVPTDRFRATPLRGWQQRGAHFAALALGWALFVWGWVDVLSQSWDIELLSWLIVGSVVALPTVTTAWVLHNVGIHRRKGPRTKLRPVDESYRHDWNGREIAADLPALAHAPIVVIDVHGDRKVYRAAGSPSVRVTVARDPRARTVDAAGDGSPAEDVVWRAA